jgi:ethanolamine ammonia-lyase large subunit
MYTFTQQQHRYHFPDLKTVLAKASPFRTGDALAGVAANSASERVAAQYCLADIPLSHFLNELPIPYEKDEVSRLIIDQHQPIAFQPIASFTVGEFRDWLLSEVATPDVLRELCWGITPEMAAAVSKIMRNQDLMVVAQKCANPSQFRNTIGLPGRLSSRI